MSSTSRYFENADSQSGLTLWKQRVLPATLACSLGLVLIYAVAFAEIAQLHNATHDVRHAAGFPCH